MASTFIRAFSVAALILSLFGLLIVTGVLLVAFSMSSEQMESPGGELSPLLRLLVENFRLFAVAWWLYFFAAVVASVGLLRQQRWAHTVWVVVLTMALCWSAAAIASEIFHLAAADDTSQAELGGFLRSPLLSALVAIPPGLFISVLLVFLLRKLLLERRRVGRYH
jgi:hypothetical protein